MLWPRGSSSDPEGNSDVAATNTTTISDANVDTEGLIRQSVRCGGSHGTTEELCYRLPFMLRSTAEKHSKMCVLDFRSISRRGELYVVRKWEVYAPPDSAAFYLIVLLLPTRGFLSIVNV